MELVLGSSRLSLIVLLPMCCLRVGGDLAFADARLRCDLFHELNFDYPLSEANLRSESMVACCLAFLSDLQSHFCDLSNELFFAISGADHL